MPASRTTFAVRVLFIDAATGRALKSFFRTPIYHLGRCVTLAIDQDAPTCHPFGYAVLMDDLISGLAAKTDLMVYAAASLSAFGAPLPVDSSLRHRRRSERDPSVNPSRSRRHHLIKRHTGCIKMLMRLNNCSV
uniref:DUF5753 domain-containing protein n=1 Tax=Steinernema glaseri TaxID=37863 RepID=A0A1I7YFK5_9BILA